MGGMLVAMGGRRGGVSETGHQLAKAGALLGSEGACSVAEVMKMDGGLPGGGARLVPCLVQGCPPEAFGKRAREHRSVGPGEDETIEVPHQCGGHRCGQVHDPAAGIGLGCGGDPLPAPQLDGLLFHPDSGPTRIDVATAQTKQLTEAKAPEAGEEHEGAVPLLDSISQAENDLGVDERPLR
ncbi:MAG: hypothetical protein M3Y91_14040 [Actinomycetota bacterium]|nr:hypothetical protein [Actinomycetota bacterium]